MSVERDAILTAQYVALTTYRRDGTPVVTPVWAAAEGTHSSSLAIPTLAR